MNKYLLILLFSLISNSLWATSYDTENVKESNDIFNFAENSLNLPKVSIIANGKVIKEFHINMDLVLIFDGIITFNLNSIRDL